MLWSENGKKSSAVCQGSERAGPEGWTSASRCQPGSRLSEHPFGYRMGRFEQHQAQGAGRIKPKLKPHFGIQERKGRVCLCNALTLTKTNTVTSLLMYSSLRFLQKWLQSGKVAGSCHWVEPRQSRWLQRQLQVAAAIYLLPSAKEKLPLPGQNSVLQDETDPAAQPHSCSSILEIKREFIYSETRAIASSCWNNYNDLRASPATSRKKGKEGCQKFVSPFRASVQTYYAAIPKPALQGMTAGGRAGLPRLCRRGEVGPCIYTGYGALNKYVELEKSKVLNDF